MSKSLTVGYKIGNMNYPTQMPFSKQHMVNSVKEDEIRNVISKTYIQK